MSACGGDSASSAADPADTSTASATDAVGTPTSEPTETTSEPSTAAPDWPACETLWVEGGKIPQRYQGCLEGSEPVAADKLSCSSGQHLVRYQEKFFGVAGGTIYEAMGPLEKDKQYLKMIGICRG